MSKYADHAHPPNAHFPGEEPRTQIDIGPANIRVTLDAWGPCDNLFTTLYDTSTATWGAAPTRSGLQPCRVWEEYVRSKGWDDGKPHAPEKVPPEIWAHEGSWEHRTGWCKLTETQQTFVRGAFAGKSLQQDLEGISLWFTIDGVSRAFTHEFVRTRLGAAFKQHGGRDNDWRHQNWTMTEAMERACLSEEHPSESMGRMEYVGAAVNPGKRTAIVDWQPIDQLLGNMADVPGLNGHPTLREVITRYLDDGKRLYAALVDAGIAWQDARRLLPIGTQTYVHGIYNFVGFRGAAANRLEFIMDWEINCVFQLMLREIRMKLPPFIGEYLGSHSDIAGRAMFDQLQLCPPDGKYPSSTIRCAACGHAETNHREPNVDARIAIPGERVCEACQRDGCWSGAEDHRHDRGFVPAMHRFIPEDTLPRIFRREQQPFFVLHPDSMNGGPIQWLWTNGHYQDIKEQL